MASLKSEDTQGSDSIVRLVHAVGQSRDGRVSELTDTGIVIDFVREGGPEVGVGEWVRAVVACGRIGATVHLSGQVVSRIEEMKRLRLRLDLNNDDLTALSLLVDRRGHQRVRPSVPLQARICSPAGESLTLATIENISRTGLSLCLSPEQARHVREHSGVFLICLLLPDDEETLELACILRNQAQEGDDLILGLEFGTTGASVFLREADRLERYVGRIQSELLEALDDGGLLEKL